MSLVLPLCGFFSTRKNGYSLALDTLCSHVEEKLLIPRPHRIFGQICNLYAITWNVVDARSIKVALDLEHDLSIESARLIAGEVQNEFLARHGRNLEPAVVRKVLCLVVIEHERPPTES
jgi:hypothetical protein